MLYIINILYYILLINIIIQKYFEFGRTNLKNYIQNLLEKLVNFCALFIFNFSESPAFS